MDFFNIIIRPLLSEKTADQQEKFNQVSFEVDRGANRIEIKRTVEKLFDVKVSSVKTMQIKGKMKKRGKILGKRKDWKKAIITLMPNERIEFFEGA